MLESLLNIEKLQVAVANSGKSMRQLCKDADVSESYLKDLVSGKVRSPSVDRFVRIATALGVYPNEIIPVKWAPDSSLNEDVLRDVMKAVTRIYAENQKESNLDLDWYYNMTIAAYKKYARVATERRPVNDNIISSWIEGTLEPQQSNR